ncbi:hypothetical protein [Actinacidiphila oryziradicis]|uniref:hypothetical protein n=1 Tax=Actinacidiphila oryziradicis TaxID=2571141 RepID=UPI001B7FFD71|nr:hypothetical protein [Actinacidiphila oryziradicis]
MPDQREARVAAGKARPLDDLTRTLLLAWPQHRGRRWPGTATHGPDPLHLAAVFGLDDTTALRYATIARQLLATASEQHHVAGSPEPKDPNHP